MSKTFTHKYTGDIYGGEPFLFNQRDAGAIDAELNEAFGTDDVDILGASEPVSDILHHRDIEDGKITLYFDKGGCGTYGTPTTFDVEFDDCNTPVALVVND